MARNVFSFFSIGFFYYYFIFEKYNFWLEHLGTEAKEEIQQTRHVLRLLGFATIVGYIIWCRQSLNEKKKKSNEKKNQSLLLRWTDIQSNHRNKRLFPVF